MVRSLLPARPLVALLAKNVHVGSLDDILTYQIDVAPDLQVTKMKLLDEILVIQVTHLFL